jgi:TRAP-type transport system periplasmic protein
MRHTRVFIALCVLVGWLGAGCGKTGTPSGKEAVITLRYANFPPAATFPCVQMEQWKQEVEKRTQGRVQVQTFPGGTLLGAKNMVDGVIAGTADIGCFAMSYQPGRFPVSEGVDMPLGFTSARVASQTLNELIKKYHPKEFEQVKVLCLFTCPPANFMTSKPVKSLADLKGMELRVSGTASEIIKRLGGTPIAMPQSETPDAIQRGVVKGMVSSMEVLKDMNYAAYCPFATRADLHVVTFAVVMNKAKWESLASEVKKVLEGLADEHALWTGTYVDNHVTEALAWSKEKYKHQMLDLPEADRKRIPEVLKPMVDDYVKKVTSAGLPGEQIVKDIREYQKRFEAEAKAK